MQVLSEQTIAKLSNTRRYSFEIYEDQTKLIDDVKYWYRNAPAEHCPRVVYCRDLIDHHLPAILEELVQERIQFVLDIE